MSRSLKALLLSGLVFPGLGQFVLKHYFRGLILMALVTASMMLIIVRVVRPVLDVVDKIVAEGGVIDINAALRGAEEATAAMDTGNLNLAFIFMVVCWIAGMVDAYRLGRKMDADAISHNSKDDKLIA
ncbi:MAG TPA: hypothetical protein EYQ50_04795 [Verrucomicrobiales bacterium]|nr:hypothetical protein [Verrucomicrobiales bacterium]HIL71466.1 hypothetical protein [Verrucomicrobiota bacterium]